MAHLGRRAAGKIMEVMVTSVENVKPAAARISSSSSGFEQEYFNKKPFKLSLIDQLVSSFYTSFVFFYPAKPESAASSPADQLKASLSKTLDPFYPFAGRLRDNLVIDDFQAGVPFVEARVHGQTLSEFLAPPDLDSLSDLVPLEPFCLLRSDRRHPQLAVQVNTFDCGGTAVGVEFHHKIADGGTIAAFLDTWSANGGSNQQAMAARPDLGRASSVFPPQRSIPPQNLSFNDNLLFQNLRRTATRRFVFGEEAIAALRRRASCSSRSPPSSRSETLSAFIWESALRASQDEEQLECVAQLVNTRSRMGQRLSGNSIGNLIAIAFAFRSTEAGRHRETMKELAGHIRQATTGIDESFLNSISGEEGCSSIFELQNWLKGKITGSHKVLVCSSWLQFDLHGFELAGLGKPAWVSVLGGARGNQPCLENFVMLKQLVGPDGGMVEAWIRLDEDIMAGLEHDPEFLEFAAPNPHVIFK